MDPFSITIGTIGVAGVGSQIAQSARDFHGNYRGANAQIQHARRQLAMLQSKLENPILQSHANFAAAQSSFEDINERFPGDLCSDSRRARFRWAAKRKAEVSALVDQLKETEISTTFALQLEHSEDLDEIKSSLAEIKVQLAIMKDRDLEEGKLRGYLQSAAVISDNPRKFDKTCGTLIKQWNTPMSKYLGANACLIVSNLKGGNKYDVFLRWHLFFSQVLNCRIMTAWPTWPSLSIYPSFKIQNEVAMDSMIVEACCRDDVTLIKELLSSGKAHSNDTTTENHTLLYLAIRDGSIKTIQLLLDSGADPNLTFGRFDTSPLNTAFYYGNVDAVRLLLGFNAQLDHVNRRTWTSDQYLYDSQFTNLHTIELLDICAAQGFDEWDAQEASGWTILHRASAFGRSSDIKKLLNLGASSNICTFTLNWLPIFCAVNFGNESTFDILADLILPWTLPKLRDSRGWTLLHLAAENGSETLMTLLLQRQLDPYAMSDASTIAVPDGLPFEEHTPGDIAKFCNNGDAYDRALKNAGCFMASRNDLSGSISKDNG